MSSISPSELRSKARDPRPPLTGARGADVGFCVDPGGRVSEPRALLVLPER